MAASFATLVFIGDLAHNLGSSPAPIAQTKPMAVAHCYGGGHFRDVDHPDWAWEPIGATGDSSQHAADPS